METGPTTTTRIKIRYWQKFTVVLLSGLALLFAAFLIKSDTRIYLHWAAGIVLVISAWYGILSVFELFERLDD